MYLDQNFIGNKGLNTYPKSVDRDLHFSGKTVNFVHAGEGTPVVLVHGVSASLADWDDLFSALVQAGYSTYALDLPGHGKSIKPEDAKEYTADKIFEHFDTWMQTLHLDVPPILVGHSLGGYLAMEYTLRHPEKVRALVLVSPFYSQEQFRPVLRRHFEQPLIDMKWISLFPVWCIRLVLGLAAFFIRNGFAPPTPNARQRRAHTYKEAHPAIYNIPRTVRNLSADFSKVIARTMLIWGAYDQSLEPISFANMADALPNAQTAVLNAGHVPNQSCPAEFNQYVLSFLQTLDG